MKDSEKIEIGDFNGHFYEDLNMDLKILNEFKNLYSLELTYPELKNSVRSIIISDLISDRDGIPDIWNAKCLKYKTQIIINLDDDKEPYAVPGRSFKEIKLNDLPRSNPFDIKELLIEARHEFADKRFIWKKGDGTGSGAHVVHHVLYKKNGKIINSVHYDDVEKEIPEWFDINSMVNKRLIKKDKIELFQALPSEKSSYLIKFIIKEFTERFSESVNSRAYWDCFYSSNLFDNASYIIKSLANSDKESNEKNEFIKNLLLYPVESNLNIARFNQYIHDYSVGYPLLKNSLKKSGAWRNIKSSLETHRGKVSGFEVLFKDKNGEHTFSANFDDVLFHTYKGNLNNLGIYDLQKLIDNKADIQEYVFEDASSVIKSVVKQLESIDVLPFSGDFLDDGHRTINFRYKVYEKENELPIDIEYMDKVLRNIFQSIIAAPSVVGRDWKNPGSTNSSNYLKLLNGSNLKVDLFSTLFKEHQKRVIAHSVGSWGNGLGDSSDITIDSESASGNPFKM